MEAIVVGAGLAGCECAWQLAERGVAVELVEQKPTHRTPAQTMDGLCELVCSNSMRGAALVNAVGLLKEEMRRAGSLVMQCAEVAKVPAGGALAVDRERFSAEVEGRLRAHPRIRVVSDVIRRVPDAFSHKPVVLATGPLTGEELTQDLARIIGGAHLAYYDAIAPIIAADSIAWDKVFRQSRWGKGGADEGEGSAKLDATALGDEAYVNCPMSEAEYGAFVDAVVGAEKVQPRAFEETRYFEGCLPVEVMAERGKMTLAFGPMKPVGLTDPRTGRRPFAVVQLRTEDAAMTAYNLVGFQTRMTYPEQLRVFRMIPGLEEAEIQRFGSVHRNTFVNSPEVLGDLMELKAQKHVHLAGQITGVEGYVESAGSGLLVGMLLARRMRGERVVAPPETTALGGLFTHVSRPQPVFQPSNITWACVAPLGNRRLKKRDRYAAMSERALTDVDAWLAGLALSA